MVSLDRMAAVLETTPANVRAVGLGMGLPPHVTPPGHYAQLGYISIIRRNWHLLNYEQLMTLLDWDAEKLAFTLKEDDVLFIKLGSLKPACPKLVYAPPSEAVQDRCAEIACLVSAHFKEEIAKPSRPRFEFFGTAAASDEQAMTTAGGDDNEPIRFIYSYSGIFGDPLADSEINPYPDDLLAGLAASGVNGVWLHVVLRQLAPPGDFPGFGEGYATRIGNLKRLVNQTRKFGIKIYLYMNEPRAMPETFFAGRENIKGVCRGDYASLCTSTGQVQRWLKESLSYLFKQVPGLGGVFTITGSENQTHCYSHTRDAAGCPRCSRRAGPEVIAELNRTIAAGVWAGNPDAAVIVWDWGWPDGTGSGWGNPNWAERIIELLPDNVYFMSVSEWSKPIQRGGVSSRVGEYSISAVGPGPRAQKHWALARKRELKTIAKVQVNSCWELSAVPYIPVMNNVAQHCQNLNQAGIDGLMLSWSVGGYPSPNLQLVKLFQVDPPPSVAEALAQVARSRYGGDATEEVLLAWSRFSEAFAEYPFHIGFVYNGPAQYGPSNLLYPEPTGYRATMSGFPYDDVERWRAVYPAEVMAGQFEKLATGWKRGLAVFEQALQKTKDAKHRANAEEDLRIARAVYLHFKSVANQIRFTLARDVLLSGSLDGDQQATQIARIKTHVQDEIANAKDLFLIAKEDPRIGFEASNHYFYLPLDLVEKVINGEYILHEWLDHNGSVALSED